MVHLKDRILALRAALDVFDGRADAIQAETDRLTVLITEVEAKLAPEPPLIRPGEALAFPRAPDV